jgi:hypothetical protein
VLRVVENPAQNLESGLAGKVQIEEQKTGIGVSFPIEILAGASEVIEGLFSIGDDGKGIWNRGLLPCRPEEEHVIIIVFN